MIALFRKFRISIARLRLAAAEHDLAYMERCAAAEIASRHLHVHDLRTRLAELECGAVCAQGIANAVARRHRAPSLN